jgi:monoamine oxidase
MANSKDDYWSIAEYVTRFTCNASLPVKRDHLFQISMAMELPIHFADHTTPLWHVQVLRSYFPESF